MELVLELVMDRHKVKALKLVELVLEQELVVVVEAAKEEVQVLFLLDSNALV